MPLIHLVYRRMHIACHFVRADWVALPKRTNAAG
jgi:hypothetical protein